jgi:polyhydroxyalkanoate synthase
MTALAAGILTYRRHPYRRGPPDPPVLWREGTTRLLDYGPPRRRGRSPGPPALVVPSLINRGYILDLSEDRSLLRWLAAAGLRPFLVDWDRPGPEERAFTLSDYIAGRLEDALQAVIAETGARPLVIGYCMGGLLALALALRRQGELAGLALLATPWDFHAEAGIQGALAAAALPALAPVLEARGELPVDMIQALFACLDPQLVARKFVAFARLDPDDPKARAFVALEDWLNDGVALAAPVARECLGGWYGENTPARGTWRVAGRPVDPGRLDLPSLCVIPAQDRIVPPGSARALAEAIPGAETMTPSLGHIGMVVSAGAQAQVWRPLRAWLGSCAKVAES